MIKRTFKTLLIGLALLSFIVSTYFIFSMFEQYKESVRWESTSSLSNIHEVPPALAKNYVSGNEGEITQVLADVNNALKVVKEAGTIPEKHLQEYNELCQRADKLLAKSKIEDGDITEPLRSLKLYIEIDNGISNAYKVVDTENLIDYSSQLVGRLNKRDNTLDVAYLNKLKEVSKDYADLESFSTKTLKALGFVEDDTLYVDLKVSRKTTDTILEELSNEKLLKFANIRRLETVLKGKPWNDILSHNISTEEYYSWEKSEKILTSLLAANYKPVSDFKELQDALDYQPRLKLKQKRGYEVEIDKSTINSVHHQGKLLDDEMYVRKGVRLTFDIKYSYKKVEKIEVVAPRDPDRTTIDRPIQGPSQQPVEQPVERPVERPVQPPVQPPVESPVQPPAQPPVERPVDRPRDEPEEDKVDKNSKDDNYNYDSNKGSR